MRRVYLRYIIYICKVIQNPISMLLSAVPSKRKIINIKEDTFKALSVMAVQHGTNLKSFIESILDRVADEYDDKLLYEYLSKTDPEGEQPLTASEQQAFENWLGVWRLHFLKALEYHS